MADARALRLAARKVARQNHFEQLDDEGDGFPPVRVMIGGMPWWKPVENYLLIIRIYWNYGPKNM
jgi:hypothetical protein